MMLFPELKSWIEALPKPSLEEPVHQRAIERLAAWIETARREGPIRPLVFVCTHNSRRSILSEMSWNALAAYNGLSDAVPAFSAGSEAARVSPNTIEALQGRGFQIIAKKDHWRGRWSEKQPEHALFSKKLGATELPASGFAAVMVCAEADAACPFVPGAHQRISMPLEDPKRFDHQDDAVAHYAATLDHIAALLSMSFKRALKAAKPL